MNQKEMLKVGIGLVVGLVAIVYFNPIHTPCQSQVDIYFEGLKPLIKPYKKNLDLCKEHTDAGGCLPFMEVMSKIELKLKELGNQCQAELVSDSKTKTILAGAMELMVKAAWGSKPPVSYIYKNGWLELTHVVLYCKLKADYVHIFSQEASDEFVNRMLVEVPGSDTLNRTEVWNRSILSDSCKYAY